MSDLSPQALAVLDAVCANTEPDCDTQHIIAAALEAAADQVVPRPAMIPEGGCTYEQAYAAAFRYDIRSRLLAIAAELRGQEDSND